jgi:hypothetical protein
MGQVGYYSITGICESIFMCSEKSLVIKSCSAEKVHLQVAKSV